MIKKYTKEQVKHMRDQERERYIDSLKNARLHEDNTRIIGLLFLTLTTTIVVLFVTIAIFKSLGMGF